MQRDSLNTIISFLNVYLLIFITFIGGDINNKII